MGDESPIGKREITRLLQDWSSGRPGAEEELSEQVYPELKKLAVAHYRRQRPGGTLQPTALVNEAYLRLVGGAEGNWSNRLQFFKFASRIMRNVLVDYFRARKAAKRGGSEARVAFAESLAPPDTRDLDLERLEDALRALHKTDPLRGRIVELRFYGGLTVDEVASVLTLSRAKVKREWAAARDWLYREVAVR